MRFAAFAVLASGLAALGCLAARADDQGRTGAGNGLARRIALASPLVQSALARDYAAVMLLSDHTLHRETFDALFNPQTCVVHRANLTEAGKQAIIDELTRQGLADPAEGAGIDGGLKAGIFPPVPDDGTACPHLPQEFGTAPGSGFHGHQSYPGGLAIHEAFNLLSAASFARDYHLTYGKPGPDGLPRMAGLVPTTQPPHGDLLIPADTVLAAPLWHDWAKTLVFQWRADGSEFNELAFGGTGGKDDNGGPGDSRTGAHHILSLAESIARHLPRFFIVAQASAHAAPTLGNEYKVVNWLRAASIIARVDPVAAGLLIKDGDGHLRLPPPPAEAESIGMPAYGQPNILIEDEIHNLSDADFVFSIPAVTETETVLARLAPDYGYDPKDTARYNNEYRNPVLSAFSGERLLVLYTTRGIGAVRQELDLLRKRGTI